MSQREFRIYLRPHLGRPVSEVDHQQPDEGFEPQDCEAKIFFTGWDAKGLRAALGGHLELSGMSVEDSDDAIFVFGKDQAFESHDVLEACEEAIEGFKKSVSKRAKAS